MPTHVQMRAKIDDFLGESDTSISDAAKTDILNMAQRELCELHDLPFAEGSATTAIALDTREINLPTDFSRPWIMQYPDPDNSDSWITLLERDYDDMLIQYGPLGSYSSGKPAYFAIYAGQYHLFPTPNFGSVNIQNKYYKILADLSADGDSNDLTNRWWPLLLYKALTLASAYLLEDDRLELWNAAFERELQKALAEANRRRFAGREVEQLQEPG